MQFFLRLPIIALTLAIFGAASAHAAPRQQLQGHVRRAASQFTPTGRLATDLKMHVSFGLPLRNPEGLTNLLQRLYDPASPDYRRFQTAEQFTEAFGPSEADVRNLAGFAKNNGLTVVNIHPNRMMIEAEGAAGDIEKALHVSFRTYKHPAEAREFYAPDSEPSLDTGTPVLHISGLDNYRTPRPMSLRRATDGAAPRMGTGPSGYFIGNDFRNSYARNVTLTGAGQSVALFELDGYYASDIVAYKTAAHLASIPPLKNVLIGGFSGVPFKSGGGNEEVALDIDMAMCMAPALSQIIVYEASPAASTAVIDELMNRIATDNLAKQIGCSWGFDIDATTQQIFEEYAAQGQSFLLASGDNGAFIGGIDQPSDEPNITVVGGTDLTTTGTTWASEQTWVGSGGGVSIIYPIPSWQQGISMTANLGSPSMRNIPDVAMIANDVWVIADNGSAFPIQGTSIAAPLWAAFIALVNQQGAAAGEPPVGFLNPAIYAIGKGANYTSDFHDIKTGNNLTSTSGNRYHAVAGFDLCTGWGTPAGQGLIDDLLSLKPADPLVITPPLGLTAFGPIGGPLNVTAQTYTLTNAGSAALVWSAATVAPWLAISPTNGTLAPGGPAAKVTVTVAPVTSQLLIGSFNADATFSNASDGVSQTRNFSLLLGNGDFEAGDLRDWNFAGDSNSNFADSYDFSSLNGSTSIQGIADALFVHSGIYGAALGQSGSLASLTQTVPTTSGETYLLSFWLDNPASGVPNQFRALWNGKALYDQSSLAAFSWTNLQYLVTAAGPTATLVFEARNDQNAFGLDDITLRPLPQPQLQAAVQASGTAQLIWTSTPGVKYQPEFTSNLASGSWSNLGAPVTAIAATTSVSDSTASSQQRFYRVVASQ